MRLPLAFGIVLALSGGAAFADDPPKREKPKYEFRMNHDKYGTGKFYMERIMPETALRKARIETGADTMMELAAEAF